MIIVEVSGQNSIIVCPGANMDIRKDELQHAFAGRYDAVMLQLEIPQIVIECCNLARVAGIPVILDAGPAQAFPVLEQVRGIAILTPIKRRH